MHTHTLLVADDSLTVQRIIQLTFADGPIRVIVATTGHEALDRIEADRPDIVLAGTDLADVDGYAIARHISTHRHLRKIPVLLLASRFESCDDSCDDQRTLESGAKGVLQKPLDPVVVTASVKLALGGARPAARRTDAASTSGPKPTRRRRKTAPIGAAPREEGRLSGPITAEALARIVGGAVAHAIATYEREHAPANVGGPSGPEITQERRGKPDLAHVLRDMGFSEFNFDETVSGIPTSGMHMSAADAHEWKPRAAVALPKPRVDYTRWPAAAAWDGHDGSTPSTGGFSFIADQLRARTARRPEETPRGDTRSLSASAGFVNHLLEPVRLAAGYVRTALARGEG